MKTRAMKTHAIKSGGAPRAVIVICDSLRADLIMPETAPFLSELKERAAAFAAHRSVFPSTTRASAGSRWSAQTSLIIVAPAASAASATAAREVSTESGSESRDIAHRIAGRMR